MHHRSPLLILVLVGVLSLPLAWAPDASAKGKAVSYDRLTATGDCLRPFTLLGYIDGTQMNLCEVSRRANVYRASRLPGS